MLYLTNINLNQNELQNFTIQNLASDPSTSNLRAGQAWFNTTTNRYKFFNGTDIITYLTEADFTTAIADYQTKITANGILKGNGAGGVSAAVAGTDYGYPILTGSGAPTTSTEGAIAQHYLDTVSGREYVCKTITGEDPVVYTWIPVTTDVSDKQDTIVATGVLKGEGSGVISQAVAGTDFGAVQLTGTGAPSTSTAGIVGQHYFDTSNNMDYVCTAIDDSDTPVVYTWSPVVTATANKALVTDANGAVTASSVTATELGYLAGATANIQTQINNIPKYNFLDGVNCTVSDGATQSEINTAAITAISAEYSSPSKWDAVVVQIKFTPSDTIKDGVYYYDGTNWVFLYYVTTGIQRANGTTAGLIEEADAPAFSEEETYAVGDVVKYSNAYYKCKVAVTVAGAWTGTDNWEPATTADITDLTLVDGVATVNNATQLRTTRNIGIVGQYGSTPSTDGITATAAQFNGTGDVNINVTAIKTEMLSGQVGVANGGTGRSSITEGALLQGNASGGFDEIGVDTTVTVGSDNLVTSGAVAAAIGGGSVVHKHSASNTALTPVSGVATWEVTHALATTDVSVQLYEVSTGKQVIADVEITSNTVVTIKINASTTIAADTYKVVIMG